MSAGIDKGHQLETYKSLIQISLEGFRLLALLNGGAAVALVAYLGNIAAKDIPVPDMRWPLGCYLAGLVLCALTLFFSYQTQFALLNESWGGMPARRHMRWQRVATVLTLLSLVAFGVGSWMAVSGLRGAAPSSATSPGKST